MKRNPSSGSSRSDAPIGQGDALLLVDLINDLEFVGGEKVLPWAPKLATPLANLCRVARQSDIPVIYVNDNFQRWRDCFDEIFAHCTRPGSRGAGVCRRLRPDRHDYFILKPKHSGFFSTSLVPLREHLQVSRLILSGIATNLCVLLTAHDAHMRGYSLVVLWDCCAAECDFDHDVALKQLERFCGATISRSTQLKLSRKHRQGRG